MHPDALCLNLKGFLSLFNLENSFLLHVLYYLFTSIVYLTVLGLAVYVFVLLYGLVVRYHTAKIKRGKSGSTFDV